MTGTTRQGNRHSAATVTTAGGFDMIQSPGRVPGLLPGPPRPGPAGRDAEGTRGFHARDGPAADGLQYVPHALRPRVPDTPRRWPESRCITVMPPAWFTTEVFQALAKARHRVEKSESTVAQQA